MNYHIGSGLLPPQKNEVKFDRGRGLLPGETYPLYPQRQRTCVDGIAKVQNLNFGVGPDPPIRTYLRMCLVTWKPHSGLGSPYPARSDLRRNTTHDRNA